MSDRERWIVYPLLFLALGAALRDKLAKRSVTEHVICEQLSVIDDQGRRVALLQGGNLILDRVDAQQVNAANLRRPATPAASGGLGLGQFLEMLQRAGGVVRVTPKTQPTSPPEETPPAESPSPEAAAPSSEL